MMLTDCFSALINNIFSVMLSKKEALNTADHGHNAGTSAEHCVSFLSICNTPSWLQYKKMSEKFVFHACVNIK